MMKAAAVFRQLLAVLVSALAWWYYYTANPLIINPPWVSIIIASFVITLTVAIISENIWLGFVIITAVYLVFGPGFRWSAAQFVPLYGGVVAAGAIWKIIKG